jgi:hypothetical protein
MNNTRHLTFALRLVSAIVLLAVLGLWLGTGAHRGWTSTSQVVLRHDEITGIDFPVREKTFVAGVEILAAGVVFAASLAGVSLLTGRRTART